MGRGHDPERGSIAQIECPIAIEHASASSPLQALHAYFVVNLTGGRAFWELTIDQCKCWRVCSHTTSVTLRNVEVGLIDCT